MPSISKSIRVGLAGLLLLAALAMASPAPAAEEYSPLSKPSTYATRAGEAPENQARFLVASLADRQRLASLELELQTLSALHDPDPARIGDLDRQVTELRAKIDKMATDMGGYIPALRHRAGDCEKPKQNRDDFGRGRNTGPNTGRGRDSGGW